MPPKFLMTVKEALERRYYYRGQLRRHLNAKRNAGLREFWNSRVAAEMRAGSTLSASRAAATRAAREKLGISASQVRRALTDTAYLMGEAELRRRIRELQQWATDHRRALVHAERLKRYRTRVRHWMKQGKTEAYAHMHAINDVADATIVLDGVEHKSITRGQMRRILRLFEIPTR